jgi:hypothetical protein
MCERLSCRPVPSPERGPTGMSPDPKFRNSAIEAIYAHSCPAAKRG